MSCWGDISVRQRHRDGGVMLPMFNPPATQAWEEFIKSQHRPQSVSERPLYLA